MTKARLDVLRRCEEAVGGLRPLGPDWYAIYWLREHGYIVQTYHQTARRFAATEKGRLELASRVN